MPNKGGAEALIERADLALRGGRLQDAEACARSATELDDGNSAAWYLLGHALLAAGKVVEGGAAFARSSELAPTNADARFALARTTALVGDWDRSALHAEQAVVLRPEQTDFHLLLMAALANAGRWELLRAALTRALERTGQSAVLHERAGHLFQATQHLDAAEQQYRLALMHGPLRAGAAGNLGLLLLEKREVVEAEVWLRKALQQSPTAEAHNNLGYACLVTERYGEALTLFKQAVTLNPALAPAHANMAAAMHRQGNLEAAFDALSQSLALNPAEPQAWYNLALTLQEPDGFMRLRRWRAEAPAERLLPLQEVLVLNSCAHAERLCLQKAVALRPHWPEARFNLGIASLRLEDWDAGWEGYAFRPAPAGLPTHTNRTKTAAPAEKTIRLHAEQGLGDILFFLRFVPSLISSGCKVELAGAERLHPVLEATGLMSLLPADDAWQEASPDNTVNLRLGDLPGWLWQQGFHEVPPPFPLIADAARKALVQEQLKAYGPPPYLGLTWRAGTARVGRGVNVLDKQISPQALGALLDGLPVTVVSLQRQVTDAEIAAVFNGWGRKPVNLTALAEAPEDALALLSVLDHHVGVSNTNVHLRASLQRTSHVLVPHPSEWRWGASGDRSPWFPQTRVYRQTADLEWHEALECLRQDLLADITRHPR